MQIPPIQSNNPQPTFGILKGHNNTRYGNYMWGIYKGQKIEVYNAYKCNQKLIYVSDSLLGWVKSKLIYVQDGVKKIVRGEAK